MIGGLFFGVGSRRDLTPQGLRRRYYAPRVAGTPLAACWAEGLPSSRTPWRSTRFLACDAEMSSLDAASGSLLSLAWVPVEEGSVYPGRGEHYLVQAESEVGDSATLHGIRDRDSATGLAAGEVLDRLLVAARGRVLVFHHAGLDLAYLNRLCRRRYDAPLLLPVIDTLKFEYRRRQRRGQVSAQGDLTLTACRQYYGLPDYPAHDALSDALATGELLLAQRVHAGEDTVLRDIVG